jgi:hypothetical protein
MSLQASGALGNPLSLGATFLTVLIFPLSGWAACLDPILNIYGPPFVDVVRSRHRVSTISPCGG